MERFKYCGYGRDVARNVSTCAIPPVVGSAFFFVELFCINTTFQ